MDDSDSDVQAVDTEDVKEAIDEGEPVLTLDDEDGGDGE